MMFSTRKQLAEKVRVLTKRNSELDERLIRMLESEQAADAEIERLRSVVELSDSRVKSLLDEIADLTTENKRLAKMVREQAAADLLLNALQAVGIIPETGKSTQAPLADYAYRQEQLTNLMGTESTGYTLSGPGGFGALFGAGAQNMFGKP